MNTGKLEETIQEEKRTRARGGREEERRKEWKNKDKVCKCGGEEGRKRGERKEKKKKNQHYISTGTNEL